MKTKRVCVIGAGPSGITALKNLLDEKLDVVVYDRNQEVGGNWIFSEDVSHSSVFETTHIISSKTLSQYEDFSFEEFDSKVSDYPSHDELRRYFQAYARKFELYQHIEFETSVKHCERIDEATWQITVEKEGMERIETFTDLIVSNGHHSQPRWPQFKGEFTGEYLHSHQFKRAAPFAGKRVLVIGGGNSACDVAVETSRLSAKTSISWRRGYKIMPKFLLGKPTDIIGEGMIWMPLGFRNWTANVMSNFFVGPNKLYGLQKPETKFGETHPTINDELLYSIRHGKVHPKVNIDRFEGKTVHFVDGTQEEFDTIIACTGYVLTHPFFDKDFIDYSSGPVPLYLKMFHAEYQNLYFIGMFQPLGCIWPLAELQARIAAKELAGQWQRPANMHSLCEKEVKSPHFKQIDTPRHTITVDYHVFKRKLKKQLRKVRQQTLDDRLKT